MTKLERDMKALIDNQERIIAGLDKEVEILTNQVENQKKLIAAQDKELKLLKKRGLLNELNIL